MLPFKQPEHRLTVNFREKPVDGYAGINDKDAYRARSRRIRSALSLNLRPANILRT
jgi:hypothetical protein